MKPSMTFEVILNKIKYLCIHNVTIHTIFLYENRYTNECAGKKFYKFPERRIEGKMEYL